MKHEDFKNSPAGNLVKATGPDGDYWAFVPNFLPPDLSLGNNLINKLADASGALGTLRSPGADIIAPTLRFLLLRREALRSSEIEGTITTLVDLYAYEARQLALPIFGTDQNARTNTSKEVANYVKATEYGFTRLEKLPVSKRLLKELHEILMEGVRGENKTPGYFRRVQNAIGSEGDSFSDARYVPPPVLQMQPVLNNLEEYMNSENHFHALIRLAIIHYQFEAIHPFQDGNGRIGRLILPMLLNQWKLLPSPLLYMSVYFQKYRDKYNHLLYKVSTKGAWSEWIMFFLEGVIQQAEDALGIMHDIQATRKRWHAQLGKARSVNLIRLADKLLEIPLITIPLAKEYLDPMSSSGARKLVLSLVKVGILEEFGSEGRVRDFWAPDVADILK